MSQFIRAMFLASCGMASGISAYAQQTEAKPQENKPKMNWRLDTHSPLGGLGVNIGPNFIKPLSEVSSVSARATIGGSLTFAEDEKSGNIKAAISPTAKSDITYHRSFLKDRIRTSSGFSAAYLKVDEVFYNTAAIKGLSANFKGSVRVVDEVTTFGEIKIPVGGNLPEIKTIGVAFTPFARAFQSLSGVQIALSHTNSQFNHDNQQNMTINSAVAGYAWKNKNGNDYFAGGVCVDVASSGVNAKIRSCVPFASMTINLD